MVLDMETYVGEYMISGGLNGGTTWGKIFASMLVNLILAAVDMVEAAVMVPIVVDILAVGSLGAIAGGYTLFLITTILYIWVIDDIKTNFDLWYAYLNGDEAAGDQIIENMKLNMVLTVGIIALF